MYAGWTCSSWKHAFESIELARMQCRFLVERDTRSRDGTWWLMPRNGPTCTRSSHCHWSAPRHFRCRTGIDSSTPLARAQLQTEKNPDRSCCLEDRGKCLEATCSPTTLRGVVTAAAVCSLSGNTPGTADGSGCTLGSHTAAVRRWSRGRSQTAQTCPVGPRRTLSARSTRPPRRGTPPVSHCRVHRHQRQGCTTAVLGASSSLQSTMGRGSG
jgi:hypothetical protein